MLKRYGRYTVETESVELVLTAPWRAAEMHKYLLCALLVVLVPAVVIPFNSFYGVFGQLVMAILTMVVSILAAGERAAAGLLVERIRRVEIVRVATSVDYRQLATPTRLVIDGRDVGQVRDVRIAHQQLKGPDEYSVALVTDGPVYRLDPSTEQGEMRELASILRSRLLDDEEDAKVRVLRGAEPPIWVAASAMIFQIAVLTGIVAFLLGYCAIESRWLYAQACGVGFLAVNWLLTSLWARTMTAPMRQAIDHASRSSDR